ncbi:hypothetical protein HRbin39_01731 [bacterium HR39]|nr:hypothetical protein HRbin39_01731 [bacterium HR39]
MSAARDLLRIREDGRYEEAASGVLEALLGAVDPARAVGATATVLHLEDVVPDEGGEAVLRHGGDLRRVVLLSTRDVEETGRAVPHVTAAGEDVSGMRFVRFAGGPTLYHAASLELEIVRVRG